MRVLWPGCALALAAAMLTGCRSSEVARPVAPQRIAMRVVESRQQATPLSVSASGTVHARETAVVSAQVTGRIEQVLVREGDSVRAGQTLVVLDDASLRAAAEQAEAGVTAAQNQEAAAQTDATLAASTLERYKLLQAEKSVSPQEMDEVTRRAEASAAQVKALRAQGEAAKAQESGARTMLGYARLRAPFAGVVTARLADPGTLAAPGMPLLQVDSGGPLQLQATVDESAIAAIRKGMKAQVKVDGAVEMNGVVAEIVPAADAASRSFTVKIDLPASAQLHAGVYGTADFAMGVRQGIFVPRSAVVQRGSLATAYVLDDHDVAQLRYVTLGASQGDAVEVLSGIAGGERLVDEPEDRDLAGKQIEAAR